MEREHEAEPTRVEDDAMRKQSEEKERKDKQIKKKTLKQIE